MSYKHMKTSSTSLVNREVQIETIMRYHFTPTRMTIKITCVDKKYGETVTPIYCRWNVKH